VLKHGSVLHYFSVTESYSIVFIYHNLFIHLSVDTYLGYFHLLVIELGRLLTVQSS
jgi:hypothetical protein